MSELWRIEPEWLFDGLSEGVALGQAVVVRDETIEAVGPLAQLDGSAIERRVLLPGVTLLPGLIDAHAHLTLCGCATPRQTVMRENNEMLLLRAASAAREAVFHGITTVRDCGDRDGVTFLLREAIRRRITEGPHLLLSGPPLTPPRGHCYFLRGEVEDQNQIRETVQTLAARGADFIKVMATGGGLTPGTDALRMQFSTQDLAFAVEEASRHGLTVASHAHSTESIAACTEVGVRTIEHASFISANVVAADPEIMQRMAEKKIVAVPTTVPARNALRSGRPLGLARQIGLTPETFLGLRQEVVGALVRSGVQVIAGTDGGATGVRITDLRGEIEILAEAGMGAAKALRAATSTAARVLGLGRIGRIEPGCVADLLGVSGNPLEDLAALGLPVFVMKAGCRIREDCRR
ncbi:MAG: amidohydrolase family protein [Bryobacteraceae bacterium]